MEDKILFFYRWLFSPADCSPFPARITCPKSGGISVFIDDGNIAGLPDQRRHLSGRIARR
jgi:hypothetical protein